MWQTAMIVSPSFACRPRLRAVFSVGSLTFLSAMIQEVTASLMQGRASEDGGWRGCAGRSRCGTPQAGGPCSYLVAEHVVSCMTEGCVYRNTMAVDGKKMNIIIIYVSYEYVFSSYNENKRRATDRAQTSTYQKLI